MSGVQVITNSLTTHPECAHGPTLLFSRIENGEQRRFFACAACRNRKDCSFFLWEDQRETISTTMKNSLLEERKKYTANVNHIKLFRTCNEIKNLTQSKRMYCHTCEALQIPKYQEKHSEHNVTVDITDGLLNSPSELLKPLDNPKKEAQYFFTQSTTDVFIAMLKDLGYKNILCIGAPRIHEKITNDYPQMTSLLMDFDKRFLSFFGPLEFSWYNLFNHHFFNEESKILFQDYLSSNNGKNFALVIDPPFGGRIEPMAESLNKINNFYKTSNKLESDLPVFLFLPYFMESQVKNSLNNYEMLDYKVDYENHALFTGEGEKGRKFGSPVRIFTNISLSLIKLPEDEGYKYCKRCDKYVSQENKHCKICKKCTSKDGRRYKHCKTCERCVKPTWVHCQKCDKCAQVNHICGEILFVKECFNCKETGHKKSECPKLEGNHNNIKKQKRKIESEENEVVTKKKRNNHSKHLTKRFNNKRTNK